MKYLIYFLALVLVSCSGSGNQESNQETASKTISQNNKSCLAEMSDPATWLPLPAAAALVNVPEAEIKQSIYQTISCQYNWKSGRTYTMKIGNGEMEVDANNVISVSIKNLDEAIEKRLARSRSKQTEMSYVEYFDMYYGPMTEEAKDQVNKRLDEKAEQDENFDEKSAETAKGLLALVKDENFTELNGLGDKANHYIRVAPNQRELSLSILHGNVVLSIIADVSDDDAEDLLMARAVAEAVMANCN